MSSIKVITVLLLYSFIFNSCNAYRILVVYPSPSHSHQIIQQAVSEGLADAGHQVTIIAPKSFETTNSNIRQIVTESVNEIWNEFTKKLSKSVSAMDFLHVLTQIMPKMMDETLLEPQTQKILENKDNLKYDAIIIENVGFMPSYAIAEHFNATLIGLISMELFPELHTAMGNPSHPILHRPNILRVPSTTGFINRCLAVYAYLTHLYWFHYELLPESDWVIKKHFKQLNVNSRQLLNKMDFTIEGQSSVLGNTRPLLPNTIQISCLHVKPVKPLPNDLKTYLDGSKHGVVYVSFGSNVKSNSLKNETLNVLIETFRGLKYDVLWKFESDVLPNKPDNVKFGKWLPQQDILAHKNIKLFLMQGGVQSLDETVARGVPVIAVPFFSDQEANADKVVELGIGRRLNLDELKQETLTQIINKMIDDPKYKEKVKVLGDRIVDTPMTPVQTAVWWIEYAIRNRGTPHLKYKGTEISYFEYFLLDVILVHLLTFIVILTLVVLVIKTCINALKTKSPRKLKKK